MVSAATHAHAAAASPSPAKFDFFTPEEAVEVEAIASRIIPSDETPGAKEAGVVYFIDRALVTFAADAQKVYREGLPGVQAQVQELFPGVNKFSAATTEQPPQVGQAFPPVESAPATEVPPAEPSEIENPSTEIHPRINLTPAT